MDRYLEQLLEELEQLQQTAMDWELSWPEILFDHISLDEEVALAPLAPLHEQLGMRPEAFPPAHQLSHSGRISLLFALEDTLRAFGYQPCYPIGTSALARYEWLRQQLNSEVPILKHHIWPLHWQKSGEKPSAKVSEDNLTELPSPVELIGPNQ